MTSVRREGKKPLLLRIVLASMATLLAAACASDAGPTPAAPTSTPLPAASPTRTPVPTPTPVEDTEARQAASALERFGSELAVIAADWDAFRAGFDDWRGVLESCDAADRRADLRAWVVEFDAVCAPWGGWEMPLFTTVSAIGRFYLKQVRPEFELYVTPLQINPEHPAMPISTPESWSRELFESLGYFYTQGLAEDTKALSGGVLNAREFWDQAQFVYHDRRRALDYLSG